jgi:hypothetical protein
MKIRRSLIRWVAATTTVVGLIVAAAAVPVSTPKAGAAAWAKGLTSADRGYFSDAARFEAMPTEYRLAMFGAMEPEQKAATWRALFARYRQTHRLSAEQDAVLAQAAAVVSPLLFTPERTRAQNDAVEASRLATKAKVGEEAWLYLYKFSSAVSAPSSLPLFERARMAIRTYAPRAFAVEGGACNCYDTSDCSYYQVCGTWDCEPGPAWWGCGPANYYDAHCCYEGARCHIID